MNGKPRCEILPLEGERLELVKRRAERRSYTGKDGIAALSKYVFHIDGEPIADFRGAWAAACILLRYCAQELAAFLLSLAARAAVVPLWKVSSAPPRRRTGPGPQGPGFI